MACRAVGPVLKEILCWAFFCVHAAGHMQWVLDAPEGGHPLQGQGLILQPDLPKDTAVKAHIHGGLPWPTTGLAI